MSLDHNVAGAVALTSRVDEERPSLLTLARGFFGSAKVDAEELAAAESFDLPGADLTSEEISEQVLPAQADEFTCASCFLVRHRSQIARNSAGQLFCTDCEG